MVHGHLKYTFSFCSGNFMKKNWSVTSQKKTNPLSLESLAPFPFFARKWEKGAVQKRFSRSHYFIPPSLIRRASRTRRVGRAKKPVDAASFIIFGKVERTPIAGNVDDPWCKLPWCRNRLSVVHFPPPRLQNSFAFFFFSRHFSAMHQHTDYSNLILVLYYISEKSSQREAKFAIYIQ
jgi:hypothetical protein